MKPVITVRDFNEQDDEKQLAYFHNASDEYLRTLGVDPQIIRAVKHQPGRVQEMLSTPIRERQVHTFAVDIDGRLLGAVSLKFIKFGESAEIHAHIFDIKDRQKGLASLVFLKVLEKAFEVFQVKKLICEPSTGNVAINGLLQKMGLKVLSTYKTPPSGILLERTANRYEITYEFFRSALNK